MRPVLAEGIATLLHRTMSGQERIPAADGAPGDTATAAAAPAASAASSPGSTPQQLTRPSPAAMPYSEPAAKAVPLPPLPSPVAAGKASDATATAPAAAAAGSEERQAVVLRVEVATKGQARLLTWSVWMLLVGKQCGATVAAVGIVRCASGEQHGLLYTSTTALPGCLVLLVGVAAGGSALRWFLPLAGKRGEQQGSGKALRCSAVSTAAAQPALCMLPPVVPRLCIVSPAGIIVAAIAWSPAAQHCMPIGSIKVEVFTS